MDGLIPVMSMLVTLLPFVALAFWLWMAWDLSGNHSLSGRERVYWQLAFLFVNVFAAVFYYATEYRKRH